MYREITDERILEQLKNDKQLSNADLRNADITAVTVNLEGANLDDANLEGANLEDTNLYNAYLDGADFSGANLKSADLEKAVIRNANFTGANLKNSKFENIKDFRGTHFNGSLCNDISFISSELSGGDFTDAHFENTEFFEIDFKGAKLTGASFIGCFFENCDFSEADLQGANFTDSSFEGADIIEAHLENADFTNVKFKNANFENSFLEGAIFQDASVGENTQFDIDKLSEAQKDQLGISTKSSLINELNKPNPDIPSLIEVIKSNKWNKEEVDDDGKTPLMVACMLEMEDIALALIDTGESNMYLINDEGDNAFKAATENNLTKVLDAFPKNIIDITQTGFDNISQEDIVIDDYLKKNPYNIVVMINNIFYFTSKDAIKKQINNNANIKYGCREAGSNSQYVLPDNIIIDIPYFSFSSLFGLQFLIKLEDAKIMMDIVSGNMFIFRKSITLVSIISKKFLGDRDGFSADHCQPGKATDVYVVFSAYTDCGTSEKVVESVKETQRSEAVEESKDELSGMSNKITILYKEEKYPISINDSTTVEELKELFLDDLKSKGIVESNKNFNVRFIFKGFILKDDLPREIKENPADFTIQAMVNLISGGRKTIKKRKNTKKKTMKKGKNKKTTKTKRTRKSYKKKL